MPHRSDVDLLVVTSDRFDADQVMLAETLVANGGHCPGTGLECSVVRAADAGSPQPPWPFLLHVNTAGTGDVVVYGCERAGDPDLLIHYATCRAAGSAVRGPAAQALIGSVAPSVIIGYLADELHWGLEHGCESYAVLNACRALVYWRDRRFVSKVAGGKLALERGLGRPEVIERALKEHQQAAPVHKPASDSRTFVLAAVELLRSAAKGPGIAAHGTHTDGGM